jgi:hypothetical protein
MAGKMWTQVTPRDDFVPFGLTINCVRTLSLGIGPLLTSVAALSTHSNTVEEKAAAIVSIMALPSLGESMFVWWFLPASAAELDGLIESKQAIDAASRAATQSHGAAGKLSMDTDGWDTSRKQSAWLGAVFFGVGRALCVSSIESATSFILEDEFKWSLHSIGIAVGVALMLGLPVSMLLKAAQHIFSVLDLQAMLGIQILAAAAATLFIPGMGKVFPIGAAGLKNDEALVLLADSLMFPSLYIANGYVDGLAMKCCEEGTLYCVENYLLFNLVAQDAFARFLAPSVTRVVVAHAGRGCYAAVQCILSLLGCFTLVALASEPSAWKVRNLQLDEPEDTMSPSSRQ